MIPNDVTLIFVLSEVLGGLCLPSRCDGASTARFLAPRMAPWRLGSRRCGRFFFFGIGRTWKVMFRDDRVDVDIDGYIMIHICNVYMYVCMFIHVNGLEMLRWRSYI